MKVKRLLYSLSCASILLLSACGSNSAGTTSSGSTGGSAKSGVTNVVFWDLFGGADGMTMKKIVTEFNKEHPDIHIQEQTQDWNQYYTKLTTAVLGGQSPDLAISHVDHLLSLKSKGVIQPVDEAASSNGIDWSKFFAAPIKGATIDGKHYAIPLDIHTMLLFYNKKVLQDSGVMQGGKLPDIKNYDEFVKILTQIKQHGSTALAYPENGWLPLSLWYAFYEQLGGGQLLNDSSTKTIFTDPGNKEKAQEAMQKVYDLYNTSKVIPPNISNVEQLFKAGKTGFIIDGTWNVDDFHNILKDNLGVVEFPTLFNQPAAWANSHTFILPTNPNRTSQQTKAAMEFVKWVTDHEYMWAKAGHIPANQSIQNTPQFKALPFRNNYANQPNIVHYFPETKTVWYMTDQTTTDVMQGILLNKIPVADGAQKLADAMNHGLNQ
jgi:multiple sugar transport system substrate-binding protein